MVGKQLRITIFEIFHQVTAILVRFVIFIFVFDSLCTSQQMFACS